MTERSSSMSMDKEQISKAFGRSFIETIEAFIAEEARLNVIYNCLTTLFDAMDHEGRALVLKKVLMHFLRKFPTDFENADVADDYIRKTLHLWRLFGKCSKTMGPVAILEKIEDSYADCWQYYQIMAEALIEERRTNTDELYKTFKKCIENCELSKDEVQRRFGSKIMAYIDFPTEIEEDEGTIQFLQVVRQTDMRKSLAARRRSSVVPSRLDMLLEKTNENSAASMGSNPAKMMSVEVGRLSIRDSARSKLKTPVDENSNRPYSQMSMQKAKYLKPLAPVHETPVLQHRPQSQQKALNLESPISPLTLQQTRDLQETIPTIAYTQEITMQTANQHPPKDDFSVFKDPTVSIKSTRPIHDILPFSPTTHSPSPKRGRVDRELNSGQYRQTSTLASSTKSFKNESNIPKNSYYGKENFTLDQNSPTLCGTHMTTKQLQNIEQSFFTSTPDKCRKVAALFDSKNPHQISIDFTAADAISPDALDKQLAGSRRKTIGLFEKLPDYQSRSEAVSAPSTHQKPAAQKSSFEKLNSLTRTFNHCNLINNVSQNDNEETTGNGTVSLIFDGGSLDPWKKEDQQLIASRSKFIPKHYNYPTQQCPPIDKNQPFMLGTKKFQPLKQIGEGGFAKVFKCMHDGKVVAVKYQKPGCSFEVHIVDTIQSVLPKNLKSFVMSIMDAFIYQNASAVVYEYLPYKTLLELSNAYRIQGAEIYGGVISLIGLQLGHILQRIHEAKVIHGDLKPDNILICSTLPENLSIEKLLEFPLIRLIDFGRAIDMNYFSGKTFTGKAKTQCFDCVEMKESRPWTYQTDFYGFVATIHTLIHHQYMEVRLDGTKHKPKIPIKRRMITNNVWTDIFDKFLNIPSCSKLPKWDSTLKSLKTEILSINDAPAWKNAIRMLNKMVQSNYEKS